MDGDSFCAYCSRMKRGIMYRLCREQGYGVLALSLIHISEPTRPY